MYNSDTVTVGPDAGQPCSQFVGCLGLYLAYPQPGAMYTDVVRVPGPENGWNAQSITCCIFQRVTSIAISSGVLYSTFGSPWTFGPVAWTSDWTEHYDPNITPSPGATPNDDVADGKAGMGPQWLSNTNAHNRDSKDLAGYTTFPYCSAYFSANSNDPSVETEHNVCAHSVSIDVLTASD